MPVTETFLTAYEPFYAAARDRLRFFPQYYRFLLSMVLDLEDLGIPGDEGQAMVDLAAAELGTELEATTHEGPRQARVVEKPFFDPRKELAAGAKATSISA